MCLEMLQMQQEQQADNKEEEKEEEADFVVWADGTTITNIVNFKMNY